MGKPSDFGRGVIYPLALFVAHQNAMEGMDRLEETDRLALKRNAEIKFNAAAEIKFNAASDHLYEFKPECIPDKNLKERASEFKKKVLAWGHGFPEGDDAVTEKDWWWAIKEAKEILLALDRLYGNSPKRATWE